MSGALGPFLLKRLALSLLTLWLLSVVVFFGCQVLPGDPARAILGPLADPRAVAALNEKLGSDRPPVEIYLSWMGGLITGDMGQSYAYRSPVAPFIGSALVNSLKLAATVFAIVVPLGIGAGVLAALRAGRPIDRLISVAGLSLTVIPEFVSSIALILVFAVLLRWLPLSASWPAGSGPLVQLQHLILPALPLVIVLFGYIARMTRAGMVEALSADYTRTAILKGLPWRTVLSRHVLRNALLPTITVIAAQMGYALGGLVVVESLFRYQGIGSLVLGAARAKDFAMLQAGILTVGAFFVVTTLLADIVTTLLDPRLRTGGRR
ncbi:peptide/nickel transport system permease protein [Angulomicrobium tetraedrale]|uniref:Peptide/nickel transport system permease protein n=1 Tax=Ancylobacter tetraedralis TaxID=217068 RepID=A0A839Z1V6_9HYPH|nr:ABC transporter permease [Ancylobacter tetraedralis]MBB3769589.1 peptide/nickel transport system permease protein [Ancylobacter tetraedralis]